MTPRRILVTGGSGFVGRHLQVALQHAFPDAVIDAPDFDVADRVRVDAAIRDIRPQACVHLAAVSAVPAARRDPDLAWRVNLHGTLHLAHAIMALAPECLFLFPASADAYGASFKAGHSLDETAPLAPMNEYGCTKSAADLALGAMALDGLRVIRLRPFNHTGPGQSAEFAVPGFARQLALIAAGRQSPVIHVGALDSQRDFLDVRDVCAAYVDCIRHASLVPSGTILNIASGVPRRMSDVLDDLRRLSGGIAAVQIDQTRLRPSEIPTASGNPARAKALLGWEPRIAWEQTLQDVLDDWTARIASPPA